MPTTFATCYLFPSCSGCGFGTCQSKEDFICLASKEDFKFQIKLDEDFFRYELKQRKIKVFFSCNGNEHDVNAWIGWLNVELNGADWQEAERIKKEVVKKWSNGNLKEKGQTINDKRHGIWTFYNKKGDLIEEIDYSVGKTTEYNPDHPENKRLGCPKKSK